MNTSNLDELEVVWSKLNNAVACCNLLAESQGSGGQGSALYFLAAGLEQTAGELRDWFDAEHIARSTDRLRNPRAVS